MRKVKIGVVGVGFFGRLHIKNICELNEFFELVGICDLDNRCIDVAKEFGVNCYLEDELMDMVDAVVIATNSSGHAMIAINAINDGKHVFIEKPMTSNLDDAKTVLDMSMKTEVVIQVDHIERFNKKLSDCLATLDGADSIVVERRVVKSSRATDVSVVHDLMIHDLDIMNFVTKRFPDRILNIGEKLSKNKDRCSVRLIYGGLSVDIFVDRNASKRARTYIIGRLDEGVVFDIDDMDGNPLKKELRSFYGAIVGNSVVEVGCMDGYNAMVLADMVEKECK